MTNSSYSKINSMKPDETNFLLMEWWLSQNAGKRTFATPKPNPNPPKPSFLKKNSFKSPKNSKNRVCLQWTLYQVVTNRPKSRFSAAEKSRVPNKIKTWINQNSVVTGIWTYPEKDKFLAVLFSEQS